MKNQIKNRYKFCYAVVVLALSSMALSSHGQQLTNDIKKIKDIVIYEDVKFHCAFPSVIKRPDGELLLAFRRAPNRKLFGERHNEHVHPNS